MRGTDRKSAGRGLLVSLLLAGAFVLGCGDKESSSPADSSPVESIVQAAAEPTQDPVYSALAPALPATPSAAAAPPSTARQARTVVLDPGHGGDEVGAAGPGLVEKNSNLDIAFRVEQILAGEGVRVVLTRRADGRASLIPSGRPLSSFSATRTDLQARIDIANSERADVFVSIHSNGSSNTGERGIEVWYDTLRPFSDRNERLASLLLTSVLSSLREQGHAVGNRGLKDDSCFRQRADRCFQLFILGPERLTTRDEAIRRGGDPASLGFAPGQDAIMTRATQMPGALVELLFMSNPADLAILRDEAARDAMSQGIARGVLAFLAETSNDT